MKSFKTESLRQKLLLKIISSFKLVFCIDLFKFIQAQIVCKIALITYMQSIFSKIEILFISIRSKKLKNIYSVNLQFKLN